MDDNAGMAMAEVSVEDVIALGVLCKRLLKLDDGKRAELFRFLYPDSNEGGDYGAKYMAVVINSATHIADTLREGLGPEIIELIKERNRRKGMGG